ncbi:hypothetical protein Mal15_05510 [Stieleria maiorica]|uniref:Uncharacterized protein n=1 Tax=Stieleria maiorica TaxID=2795974 RepID=A0A5B9M777_9BACT|nr:hypothetical protein [Stieleria maiorica]QEF96523.1 hypothetical protein Mal15_05510 [Stieleria maiorica]
MSNHNQTPGSRGPLGIDSEEPSLSQAQPYRTPPTVGDGIVFTGALRSPLLWIIVAATTGFVIVGGFILLTPVRDFNEGRRPVKPIPQYVEDFGMNRVPVEDFDDFDDMPVIQPPVNDVAPQGGTDGPVVP